MPRSIYLRRGLVYWIRFDLDSIVLLGSFGEIEASSLFVNWFP